MTTTGSQVINRAAANPWPERFARLGLAARGVLFIVIGILTFRVALGHFEDQASQNGALQQIASQPGGKVLVWIVAIGLIGYALWRLVSAAFGPVADPVATGAKQRVKALAEGIGYGAVAVIAVKVATGSGSSSSGGSGSKQAATVLSWPGGQFLVGLAAVVIIGVGLYYIYDGWTADFTKELKVGEMSPKARKAVIALGRFGRVAQGMVFCTIGVLVMIAAVTYDPDKAKGLDGALKTLVGEPFGQWLLGFIALGLVAYGVYGLAEAKLRRIS
ncbi:MAG TPA: DUF1206 domain-containing protein [Mycobacteriales bacterium]